MKDRHLATTEGPNALTDQSTVPECRDCGETITDRTDHETGCINENMAPDKLYAQRERDAEVQRAEHKREQQLEAPGS